MFSFFLIAVLICYIYFITYRRAPNVSRTMQRCLFWPILWRIALNVAKMRPGLFQKHYALCDGVLTCIQFSWSLVLLIFNFFRPLLFKLVYREFFNYSFIICIGNPARLLGRSFLQKQLTTECSLLFLQNSPS